MSSFNTAKPLLTFIVLLINYVNLTPTHSLMIPSLSGTSVTKGNSGVLFQMSGTETDEVDGFVDDPDLMGVYVDGFPLPKIPVREDDDELLAFIRRVPVEKTHKYSIDEWQPPGELRDNNDERPVRVIIAGGGLGGLSLASTLLQKKGFDVHIFEQARQYKPFGGPIQIQSNALWALREINPALYSAVEECGVRTGDRLSGIKDGKRYEEGWLVKFDAASPAIRCGLPFTLAINRVALQEIFLKYGVPSERVHTSNRVLSYKNLDEGGVSVTLEDGSTVYGDILIGCDGIWSRVRHQMHGLPEGEEGPAYATKHARYSGYTCFTGTCKHTPIDIDEVAYKVFLGQEQYFGCTDTGHGWQHWWAFLSSDPLGTRSSEERIDSSGAQMLDRLREEFKDWSPEIHDLFDATAVEVVKRRDLFDRLPLWNGWVDGSVALLGDAAHPTMPNLGQGGAMAIEDAYVLGQELSNIKHCDEINGILKRYEKRRFVRANIAQFLSRNGSDLLSSWDTLRTTPIVGPIAMKSINMFQPLTMDYLYSSKF